mmetsp:Transcript_15029/g.37539  ORF Transcript_15029/g.37539 Transcript_15029/m.37539 type:complete len:134 (+) Transcript_15029:216-617(+)
MAAAGRGDSQQHSTTKLSVAVALEVSSSSIKAQTRRSNTKCQLPLSFVKVRNVAERLTFLRGFLIRVLGLALLTNHFLEVLADESFCGCKCILTNCCNAGGILLRPVAGEDDMHQTPLCCGDNHDVPFFTQAC